MMMHLSRPCQFALLLVIGSIGLGAVLVQPAGIEVRPSVRIQPTPFLTPTPGPDGKIIYIVQEGDTLWRIAAIAGISVEELMTRNGIQPDDFISEGMQLELGSGGPIEPVEEPGQEATAEAEAATPTPIVGTGEICVLLYLDANGDARLNEDEDPVAEGKVSVVDVNGALVGEHNTDLNPDGYCFPDLMNGDYNVSAAVPPDYNPTTVMNVPVRLEPGDISFVQFGAQPSSALQGIDTDAGGDHSTLLGLLGVALLLGGIALGTYAYRYRRQIPRSLR